MAYGNSSPNLDRASLVRAAEERARKPTRETPREESMWKSIPFIGMIVSMFTVDEE